MCNLYTEGASTVEVAAHFGVGNPMNTNAGGEVYPGGAGMIVQEGEGQPLLQSMTWGFPTGHNRMPVLLMPDEYAHWLR